MVESPGAALNVYSSWQSRKSLFLAAKVTEDSEKLFLSLSSVHCKILSFAALFLLTSFILCSTYLTTFASKMLN